MKNLLSSTTPSYRGIDDAKDLMRTNGTDKLAEATLAGWSWLVSGEKVFFMAAPYRKDIHFHQNASPPLPHPVKSLSVPQNRIESSPAPCPPPFPPIRVAGKGH